MTRASAAKRGPSAAGKPAAPSTGTQARVVELEADLAATRRALQTQRADYEADSQSFERTLARLALSERALSQTTAKLVHLETAAEATAARVLELEARALAAEAREQEVAAQARAIRFERAANMAECEELQGKMSELRVELASLALRHTDATGQLSAAEARIKVLTHERTRLLELMASLDVLGREIAQLTNQAIAEGAPLPKVEAWLGRDVEAEHVRATVRPEGPSAPPPNSPAT